MAKEVFLFITVIYFVNANARIEFEIPRNVFDTDLYENVLDEELCEIQLNYIMNNNSMLRAACEYIFITFTKNCMPFISS